MDLIKYEQTSEAFVDICKSAGSISIAQNAGAAFEAVIVVKSLKDLLTDEVMKDVFMPLMNTKVGFLTDRNGKPNSRGEVKPLYTIEVVRDAIVDAICFGLLPTFNQFNIIADRMYPTKEGYTSLLKKIGVKYVCNVGLDKNTNQTFAEIPVQMIYEHKEEKKTLTIVATVKKDSYSSPDQLKGKAERRGKKALFEYITGCDFGDADEESSKFIDITDKQAAHTDPFKAEKPKAEKVYKTEAEAKTDFENGVLSKDEYQDICFKLAIK